MIDEPGTNRTNMVLHLLPTVSQDGSETPSPLPYNPTTTPSSTPGKTLAWPLAGLILFSFTAPGALVSVPFAIGTTGYVLGMLVLCLFTLATCAGCLMLLEIYLAHPSCQNLPELGAAAMGPWGRRLAAAAQLCNFVGFLPVSLTINALALQGTVGAGPDDCLDLYILLISLLCFCTTQVRVLTNTQALALLSLGAILAAGGIQLSIAFSEHMPLPTDPPPIPARLIGHPLGPNALLSTEIIRTFLGLTCMSWSFVPCFLVVELASSMPKPRHFTKSLGNEEEEKEEEERRPNPHPPPHPPTHTPIHLHPYLQVSPRASSSSSSLAWGSCSWPGGGGTSLTLPMPWKGGPPASQQLE